MTDLGSRFLESRGKNGERSEQEALWTSTAQDGVEIVAEPMRGRASLTVRVWNIWKHPQWGSTRSSTAGTGLLVDVAFTSG